MSSQGSVSTAQAAGSGPAAAAVKGNKMKLDMPPRPAKAAAGRRPPPAAATNAAGANAAGAAGAAGAQGNNKDDGSVPHVVRVTFLGVAGLLAKPPHPDGSAGSSTDGGTASRSGPISACSPAADHPSLLFPLPPNMRVVASVSRSRTARGIPSGMSRRLAPSEGGQSDKQRPPSLLSPGSTAATAGSFALSPTGEKILVEKQQSSSAAGRGRPNIEEISIERDGADSLAQDGTISSAKGETRHRRKGSRGSSFLPPPSRVMHTRTGSTRGSSRGGSGKLGGASSVGSSVQESANSKVKSQLSTELEQDESIEVVRPYSPTDADVGKKKGGKAKGGDIGESSAEEPERFVAVWDENSRFAKGATRQPRQYVNLTNSLAFEAELRPSASVVKTPADEGRATPVASTTFAPKSFCVTVGLVPDFDASGERSTTPVLDDLGETSAPKSTIEGSSSPLPTFAIPVGFADLVINGDETLDGRRRQIDLPLSSLAHFIGTIGGAEKIMERGSYPFPLIELTTEGLGATQINNNESKRDANKATSSTPKEAGGKKKRGIVKRMFSRKQQQQPAAESAVESRSKSPLRVHSGKPASIFDLSRPPNPKERTLFLERYGVDPSGDAVVRIGLEVFPRGSELEKVFRQKNRLRKKAQAAAAASSAATRRSNRSGRPMNGRRSPGSVDSRTVDTSDSRSLMDDDDDDEDALDSDCDSVFSQSFFTLDSDASRTTWDESTMYTDALSSYNTAGDDSMTYTTEFTEYEKSRSPKGNAARQSPSSFLSNLFACAGPTTCGDINDEEDLDGSRRTTPADPYADIDRVASAVASMSMAEPAEGAATPASPVGPKSVTSMDTVTRANHRATSPESVKESGEELALDGLGPAAGKGPPPPLDTAVPIDRAHTVTEETSPLAMIKQRVANDDLDGLVGSSDDGRRRDADDEGHELTLEDHQSASM